VRWTAPPGALHYSRGLPIQINDIKIKLIDDVSFRKLLLNFTTYECICPSITFHSQSNLSPSFNFHCLTLLIGIVVLKEANFEEALFAIVISPSFLT